MKWDGDIINYRVFHDLLMRSGLALLSAAITLLFVKPLTTGGMAREDEEFRAYLEANGYDTSQMGLRSESSTVVDDLGSDNEKTSA